MILSSDPIRTTFTPFNSAFNREPICGDPSTSRVTISSTALLLCVAQIILFCVGFPSKSSPFNKVATMFTMRCVLPVPGGPTMSTGASRSSVVVMNCLAHVPTTALSCSAFKEDLIALYALGRIPIG